MIDIFYTKFEKEIPKYIWNRYLELLPEDIILKNSKYIRWQDRHAHLLGKLLLIEGLKKYNIHYEMLGHLKYNEYNRPYLTNNIDFNISHSGEFVICSIGKDIRLGIDIEKCRVIKISDFANIMTDEQWENIINSQNPLKAFFKFWTIKESVIKADSRGLFVPLLDIHVNNNIACYDKRNWYLNEFNFSDDYCGCLACNKPNTTINFFKIDL
jgi:4'-phosphopantetheinyl transferase